MSSRPARLRTLAALPRGERAFAVRATVLMLGVRIAMRLLPFPRLRQLVDWLGRARPGAADEGVARAVRRAVDRAARSMPGSACLDQALTAELLLRRAGQPVRVSIGVAPDGRPLDAHAWVESGGFLVTGDTEDLHTYRTLVVFGDDVAPGGAA